MIRPANPGDRHAVEALLEGAGLPLAGLDACFDRVLVHEADGRVTGAIGIEDYGEHGLLRSAVVHPDLRGSGIGRALTERVLERAGGEGKRAVYLLTMTAAAFFRRFGFEVVDRADVPAAVRGSVEFREACPATATVMRKVLT